MGRYTGLDAVQHAYNLNCNNMSVPFDLDGVSVDRGPRRAVAKTEGSRAEPSNLANPNLDANSQQDQPCSIT